MTNKHTQELERQLESVKSQRTQLIWGVRNTRSCDRQKLVEEAMALLKQEKSLSERLVVVKAISSVVTKVKNSLPFVTPDEAQL